MGRAGGALRCAGDMWLVAIRILTDTVTEMSMCDLHVLLSVWYTLTGRGERREGGREGDGGRGVGWEPSQPGCARAELSS